MEVITPRQAVAAARRIVIVQERPNPSKDFFVDPLLHGCTAEVVVRGFDEPLPGELLKGALVILVRYVPPAWKKLLEAHRHTLEGLVLFMDDDLLDLAASQGLPWRYRWKLARLAGLQRNWLRGQRVALWVSTPFLARKYAEWRPGLLQPAAWAPPTRPVSLFYHGSASHGDEIRWLREPVAEALRIEPRLSFEIIGDQRVQRLYAGVPRVTVVRPMAWHAYQHFLLQPGRDIGLAPLVDNRFNQARSYTKFFDISRAGAVGLYPRGSIFEEVVQDGINGRLLPMEPQAWCRAILELTGNCRERTRLSHAAQVGCTKRQVGA
ncbi:glycosyltransferase family 1 protein [Billgrantia lactosivorans]|uniref:glycosyltransferase family 1 protein n=1 Tax=Billgrantia lactosivorans TaxID=2185141 RepID=UPI0015D0BA09|nr:glycosyltransferase family 1 protein [Halomonas lactosivorans]